MPISQPRLLALPLRAHVLALSRVQCGQPAQAAPGEPFLGNAQVRGPFHSRLKDINARRTTEITCAADTSGSVGGATYPATNAGTQAAGVCLSGYSGSSLRSCGVTGVWANPSTSCSRTPYPGPYHAFHSVCLVLFCRHLLRRYHYWNGLFRLLA